MLEPVLGILRSWHFCWLAIPAPCDIVGFVTKAMLMGGWKLRFLCDHGANIAVVYFSFGGGDRGLKG